MYGSPLKFKMILGKCFIMFHHPESDGKRESIVGS